MIYPGATYRPLNQFSNGPTMPRLGAVLHVNDSVGPSLYHWIAGDNGMSCHFQVAYNGDVEQYVDTDNGSWCQMGGNDTYISVETEGLPSDALTNLQVHAVADIMRWLHETHGIPLALAEQPGERGLIWHGAGGNAWGGHPSCPGDLRKAQRATILQIADGRNDMAQADVNAINKHTDQKFHDSDAGLVRRLDSIIAKLDQLITALTPKK